MNQVSNRTKEIDEFVNRIEKQHRRIYAIDCFIICDIFMELYEHYNTKIENIEDELIYMYNWILKSKHNADLGVKKCVSCREIKNGIEFYKNNTSKNGLSSKCILCSKEYGKEYRKKQINNYGKQID